MKIFFIKHKYESWYDVHHTKLSQLFIVYLKNLAIGTFKYV